jgi:hypothetical protein
MAALYSSTIKEFLSITPAQLLGELVAGLAAEGFDTNKLTTSSWQQEIGELHKSLGELVNKCPPASNWHLLLEYILPIIGQRLDCVILADDLVYVIEYKGGTSSSSSAALRQAQEYALNLVDFHEESRGRVVVPIALGNFKKHIPLNEQKGVSFGASGSPGDLSELLFLTYGLWGSSINSINPSAWNESRYFPVPTIIEAASAVYLNHDVKNITFSRSGIDNLEATQRAIEEEVCDARKNGKKKLIVITGVPGAGKTLAGLNAVQYIQNHLDLEKEQASFLSGNGPLVKVLQEALKQSVGRQQRGDARSIQTRIRDMHRFVRDCYGDTRAPADRFIVFDEAQRSWTAEKNKKKFGRDIAEPEMVLEIMGRHNGWAVIVALVGGGQEIHGGEAGLAAWGIAISKNTKWEVITSPEALYGGASVAGSRLFASDSEVPLEIKEYKSLHLAISKRSYTTEITSAWVNALLNSQPSEALKLVGDGRLPIYLTRNLNDARQWLRNNAKGKRRAGLIASSGASRLRAEGVETPTFTFLNGIDYPKWFLAPEGDYRSSNQLEVALSEFELQGLELDLSGLLWGGDLVFHNNQAITRKLRGLKWVNIGGLNNPQASADDPHTRILNKYRVLLTRFRKGMVIFIPKGACEDATYSSTDFDSVYSYLLDCGVKELTKP